MQLGLSLGHSIYYSNTYVHIHTQKNRHIQHVYRNIQATLQKRMETSREYGYTVLCVCVCACVCVCVYVGVWRSVSE